MNEKTVRFYFKLFRTDFWEYSMGKNNVEKEPRRFYTDALNSEECQCDKVKRKGLAVCYSCYSKLPQEIQSQLWKKIGRGFEEGYEQAVKYLQDL